ncbi:CoA transferase [Rhodobacteraceae bacterium D3-12]|nr:CoA transferase [Rhodobacteraceae bacterium D3-12]
MFKFTDPQSKSTGPLAGLRVLDLSRILAGPTCTQLLGDLGADVIKIERPGVGDDTRRWGPPFVMGRDGNPTDQSAYFVSSNRNKRSVALDISLPEDAEAVRRMTCDCDILVENFKTGGLEKYGLDYKTLSQLNPGLIYCSITGFGQSGPNATRPGYDLLAQAFGGIMSLTGEPEGEPMKVGVGAADVMCGMYASSAVLAALHHREKTGEGQHIDLALVDTQVAWLVNGATNYLVSGELPQRFGNQHPNIVPYQVFETSDGHVIVAVGNDAQFQAFCRVLECPALAEDSRFVTNEARLANRDALIAIIAAELRTHSKSCLLGKMEASGVPSGPINRLDEVFASEQVGARAMKISMPSKDALEGEINLIGNPIKFSRTPVTYRRSPPTCGADTQEVLREFGLWRENNAETEVETNDT